MSRSLIFLCLGLCLGTGSFLPPLAAVSAPPLPESTSWSVDWRVESLLAGGLGETVRDLAAQPPLSGKLGMLEALTGMPLPGGLKRLVFFGVGSSKENAALLVDGAFDRRRLTLFAQGMDKYTSKEHRGLTIHRWYDPNEQGLRYGCFLSEQRLLIAASSELVMQVLDVAVGTAAGKDLSGLPVTKDAGPGVWLRAWGEGLDGLHGVHPQARVLQQVRSLGLVLREQGDRAEVAIALRGIDEPAAVRVEQVLAGLRALVEMSEAGAQPGVKELLGNLQMQRQAETVALGSALPMSTLVAGLQAAAREHRARRLAEQTRARLDSHD